MGDVEDVASLTRSLRADAEPFWARLRDCFREKGIDPERSALAELFPDGTNLLFGIVVTADREVYEFDFDWLHKSVDQGEFSAWRRRGLGGAEFQAASSFLDTERAPG